MKAKGRTRDTVRRDLQMIWSQYNLGTFHPERHEGEIDRLMALSEVRYRAEMMRLHALGASLPRLRR